MEDRLNELEIKIAYQDEVIEALQKRHLALEEALQLQQAQLRYLYQQMQPQQHVNEKPPHY